MFITIIDKMRSQIKWLTQQVECLKKEGCLCFSFETNLSFNEETRELSATFVDDSTRTVVIPEGGAGFTVDEEDLTVENNVLKFKDREPFGERIGYKIIRENFDFNNIPTDYANSIWEIRYEHDLGQSILSLPEGVILRFVGGYIHGGTLIGDQTSIIADQEMKIFGEDVSLLGSWGKEGINAFWFGAQGNGSSDDTSFFKTAISNLSAGEVLLLPQKVFALTESLELGDIDLKGFGQASQLRFIEPIGNYATILSRGTNARYGIFEKAQIYLQENSYGGVYIDYPRFRMSNTRIVGSQGALITDALLHVENSWITTLDNVFCTSPEDIVGLRLSTFSNAIDIIGGEYATGGNPIVVDVARRLNIQTTIEGVSLNRGDGLVINGGDTIKIDSYFEDKGLTINGGERITIGNSSFANDPATVKILGGKNITFDGAYWPATTYPRDAVYVGSGLDHEVMFKQSCKFFDGTSQFVISNSIVEGENVGKNLIIDPFFNNWNGSSLIDHIITKQGSTTTISQSLNKQIGNYSLRWDANGAATGSQGIFIDMSHLLPELLGGWATVGAWVFIPEAGESLYRVRLVTSNISEEDVYPSAAFQAKKGAWVYFSHSKFIDPSETSLRVEIFCLGNKTGVEFFEVDRIALIRGRVSQNIPIQISDTTFNGLKEGDNISKLNNDAGYITESTTNSLYLSKNSDTEFSGDILKIGNNKNIQLGGSSQIRGGSNSGTFFDLIAGDFSIRNNTTPILVLQKDTGTLSVQSIQSNTPIFSPATLSEISNGQPNILTTKEWVDSNYLNITDQDETKTLSLSGSLEAGRYFTINDYDDPNIDKKGIKTYVRDGEWIISKNDNEQNALKIMLSGQEVYHAGNLRSNLQNDQRYLFPSRIVATGTGLTGGGDLTTNRTISLTSISAGANTVGALQYNSLTKANGQFYGGNADPTEITRLNYDGNFHATEFITPSDIRLKTNLKQIENPIEKVQKLTGYTYTMKANGRESTGLAAQELIGVFEQGLDGSEEEGYGVKYGNMVGLLVEAIKEQQKQIDHLEDTIIKLKQI